MGHRRDCRAGKKRAPWQRPLWLLLLVAGCAASPSHPADGADPASAQPSPSSGSSSGDHTSTPVTGATAQAPQPKRPPADCPGHRDEVRGPIPQGCPRTLLRADQILLLNPIDFEPNRSELVPRSDDAIHDLAALLHDHQEIEVVNIEVHLAVPVPSIGRNLSGQRADAIRRALLVLGVESRRLVSKGFGADRPLEPEATAGNGSGAARNRNRRVEFRIVSRGSVVRVPLP